MKHLKELIKNELMLQDELFINIINNIVINKIENYVDELDNNLCDPGNVEVAEVCKKINSKLNDENYDFNNDTVKILIHDAMEDLIEHIKEIYYVN